jgi:hypothetical protein
VNFRWTFFKYLILPVPVVLRRNAFSLQLSKCKQEKRELHVSNATCCIFRIMSKYEKRRRLSWKTYIFASWHVGIRRIRKCASGYEKSDDLNNIFQNSESG